MERRRARVRRKNTDRIIDPGALVLVLLSQAYSNVKSADSTSSRAQTL